jgi:RNA polymerase sigma-70 factor (ECF subfamily)
MSPERKGSDRGAATKTPTSARDADQEEQSAEIRSLQRPIGIEALYRAHVRTVLGWVIRLGGPELVPEEVAQDVFEVVLNRAHTFQEGRRAEAWLWGITRRVVANARRRARFRRFLGLGDARTPVSGDPGPDELYSRRRRVQEMLSVLSHAQREAVVLVDLEGRSAVEAAELLEVPVNTVYSRLHTARRALGAKFLEEGVLAPALGEP